MNHHEIEQQDIIERYVRHQLKPEERRTFQEHYFACDECFEQVQTTAKFIAGVQRSSRLGTLAESAREVASSPAASWWSSWFTPAFALAATACLLLAVALGWIVFKQIPQMQSEIAQERQAREVAEQRTAQTPQITPADLEKERERAESEKKKREELENKIARNETPTPAPVTSPNRTNTETKANVPVVILESTRDAKSGTNFKLPENANSLTLWVEVEAGGRFDSFQMQVFDASGRAIKTINGLKANSYGALAASVSTQQMPPGKYLVKLFGLNKQQKEFVGEYDLTLRK
ncbi:MAG: zf-HC2 domain-containing protein [Acidobacteria bacterium]|nr:zf-HC2 domain-containing protein [Acidobacteriota bacterium]